MANKLEKGLKELLVRVEKLEQAVYLKPKKITPKLNKEEFKGATGGVKFLVTKGFFDKKRSFGEIRKVMEENDYHYSPQAVQTPLTRLSKTGGLLVAFKVGGKKVYVKRK